MNLANRDKEHIWHPLTQHQTARAPLGIVKAEGALLWDESGNCYIDGISSWYTAMYGHGHPEIVRAMTAQLQQLDFVMFSGFTHRPAVELSEALMKMLPSNQRRLFFNDNGSTAVEAALKMALQYHHNADKKRDTLIAFEDGFHGDTFGAMSASGLSSYNGPFEDFLLKVIRIATPQENTINEVKAELQKVIDEHDCAAFVFEPLVQGAAGMKFHSADGLSQLIEICQKHDVLCIADEVMTGFGKTGTTFASDQLKTKPDIMCLSKALTAGMFPLSITTCTSAVFDRFLSEETYKGFFHAHTYSAHPVGCAAALAALKLLDSSDIVNGRKQIEDGHETFAKTMKDHPKVAAVRTMGVILAIDLNIQSDRYGSLRDTLYHYFLEEGVILRPLGNTIYVLPPFVIASGQLQKIYDSIEGALLLV